VVEEVRARKDGATDCYLVLSQVRKFGFLKIGAEKRRIGELAQ
jgi:hypothetical protein